MKLTKHLAKAGLDVTLAVAESLYAEFREPHYAPPPRLQRMVDAGMHAPEATSAPVRPPRPSRRPPTGAHPGRRSQPSGRHRARARRA